MYYEMRCCELQKQLDDIEELIDNSNDDRLQKLRDQDRRIKYLERLLDATKDALEATMSLNEVIK